ncbi:hypothetical protein [Mycoplasmopsis cricetuli]|uniref:hypothetical protein n=1 Tax=Mycoplasmopsis cricetuli TaxID=171283 RepID=UPI00046E5BDD|nr:hypothetical protein [Mycoplasmopsis cricetuli]
MKIKKIFSRFGMGFLVLSASAGTIAQISYSPLSQSKRQKKLKKHLEKTKDSRKRAQERVKRLQAKKAKIEKFRKDTLIKRNHSIQNSADPIIKKHDALKSKIKSFKLNQFQLAQKVREELSKSQNSDDKLKTYYQLMVQKREAKKNNLAKIKAQKDKINNFKNKYNALKK